MENINHLLSDEVLARWFLKLFGIVLSVIFLLYALVIERQTKTMVSVIKFKRSEILILISVAQIISAIVLLLLSIFIL